MDDSELQRIRAARLAQLQAGGSSGQQQQQQPSSRREGGGGDADEAGRHDQLSSLLEPAARDRLRRIALVKPPYARQIESMLLSMARSGRIRQRVTEPELVAMLTDLSSSSSSSGPVSTGEGRTGVSSSGIKNLRRNDDDSDDDF